MITTYHLSGLSPQPHEPGRKPYGGPSDWHDPDGRACVASWQAHVDAGRIGVRAEVPDAVRAVVLANERLICGRQRTIID